MQLPGQGILSTKHRGAKPQRDGDVGNGVGVSDGNGGSCSGGAGTGMGAGDGNGGSCNEGGGTSKIPAAGDGNGGGCNGGTGTGKTPAVKQQAASPPQQAPDGHPIIPQPS